MYIKICVVTGSRAEYGNLYCLMKKIKKDKKFKLQIIVTGSHLSSDYGFTYKEIIRDGFKINAKINLNLNKIAIYSLSFIFTVSKLYHFYLSPINPYKPRGILWITRFLIWGS